MPSIIGIVKSLHILLLDLKGMMKHVAFTISTQVASYGKRAEMSLPISRIHVR